MLKNRNILYLISVTNPSFKVLIRNIKRTRETKSQVNCYHYCCTRVSQWTGVTKNQINLLTQIQLIRTNKNTDHQRKHRKTQLISGWLDIRTDTKLVRTQPVISACRTARDIQSFPSSVHHTRTELRTVTVGKGSTRSAQSPRLHSPILYSTLSAITKQAASV